MKLLIDMNLSAEWTEFLGTHGFEAVHWSRIGRAYEADETIMEHARQHGYIVLTEDLDFGLLLAQTGAQYPSVLQLRTQANLPFQIGDRVIGALQEFRTFLERGALLTFDVERLRTRKLPISRKNED
jgi:predicted nuclease of predicted toxin-antitoxin system